MEDDFTAANGKSHSIETKSNKQKMKKIEWTPELHKKFVEAVDQLGVEQAVPSRILKFMKVEGLTRENIASHLQKYRKQLRQSLPQARDYSTVHWSYHSNDQIGPNDARPLQTLKRSACVYSRSDPAGQNIHTNTLYADVWCYPVVHPSCPTNPQLQADVWGYPIGPSSPTCPQNGYYSAEADWIDAHPGEEMIDKVVNEVMSKPWLPLPLGLKFHSIDTILTELS